MRSSIVVVAVVVAAACSRTETPAADSPSVTPAAAAAPLSAADIAGTWDGQGMPMTRDTVVVTFTMTNDSTGRKSTLSFPSGEKVDAKSVTFSGDSVVTESGLFRSQLRKGQMVTTRSVLRMQGGKLVGIATSKYEDGDTASFRLTATKKP